ncbi:hypothetical protein EVAR_53618_1 [Eumeta japonica]|uniref:Uncharacterized protein n=1 Tax=Eumeta variegata TaxID=151549 RepID=A0A4C1X2H7_EUMVA|nr:hypothetical protein EVAR_53618_1 [Eumeta japonica]
MSVAQWSRTYALEPEGDMFEDTTDESHQSNLSRGSGDRICLCPSGEYERACASAPAVTCAALIAASAGSGRFRGDHGGRQVALSLRPPERACLYVCALRPLHRLSGNPKQSVSEVANVCC